MSNKKELISKELKRWFGPSPMSMPLMQRIENRGIMQQDHNLIIYTALGDQKNWYRTLKMRYTKRDMGAIKNIGRKMRLAQI